MPSNCSFFGQWKAVAKFDSPLFHLLKMQVFLLLPIYTHSLATSILPVFCKNVYQEQKKKRQRNFFGKILFSSRISYSCEFKWKIMCFMVWQPVFNRVLIKQILHKGDGPSKDKENIFTIQHKSVIAKTSTYLFLKS